MNAQYSRRGFLDTAALTLAASPLILAGASHSHPGRTGMNAPSAALAAKDGPLGRIRQVEAGELSIGYAELGPETGTPVILLHGWPYDIHSYAEAGPMLAAYGCRVIVPHLRGHGTTRFLNVETPRSGQQAAVGQDVIALMDALQISRAVLAGYDWGGRAACIVAALWPERCAGLVSVNGYLIQDIAKAGIPLRPQMEAAFWYQFYFLTERGRVGLTANRREIARLMWARNSPKWQFDDAVFDRSAPTFDNPDYVEVTIHSYRHRLGLADGFPHYETIERRLAMQPLIAVPTITLDGSADGVVPATDGRAAAARFSGERQHRIVPDAGHNLPQENPTAFAAAVRELAAKFGDKP